MFTCMQDKYVIVMLTCMEDKYVIVMLVYARQVCYCNAMFTSMQDKYVIVMLCLLVCKTSMLL